jgi:nitrous oxidase accessory protein
VLGVTIDGSGGRFDLLDAALKVHADDVTVEGVLIKNATFGILAERANRVEILGCEVQGDPSSPHGLRGDGIRLWEVRDSRVLRNIVRDSRDVVIWYSSRNNISGNFVAGGRYGSHLMYSHANIIDDNRYIGNVVGIFIMYSREIHVERNLLADSGGAAGMGLGVKESGNLDVVDNLFVHDTVGIYLDTSPLQLDDRNDFRRNEFRLGGTAIVFHSSPSRNLFVDNLFADNRVPVSVEGDGDALGTTFEGNDFDDYEGFDLDGDGFGDLPYELRMLSSQLTARHPELAFFSGTPALGLVDAVGRAVPLFTPKPIVRDPHPRMGGAGRETKRAN